MADPYHIDWSADLTPALALLGQSRRAKRDDRRADEYLRLQGEAMYNSQERQSHEEARQAALDKRKQAIEDFNARDLLFRQAQRSPEAASQNPYGYSFEAHNDLPANVEGPELSPTAEAARFMVGGPKAGVTPVQAAAPQAAPDFDRPHMPSPSPEMRGPQMAPSGYQGGGMDAFTDDARQRSADNVGLVGQGLQGPQPEQPLMMQAASNSFEPGPEGKRRIFANYQGNRFELPEQPETSGFGAKYDAIYRRALQEPGVTPEEAYRFVAKMAHDDTAEQGKNTRLTESLTQRNTNREDAQTFTAGQNETYRLTAEEQAKLRREGFKAHIAAAGAGPVSPVVPELIRMTEEGSPASDVYTRAAAARVPQKQFATATQNVVKNAAAGERASEKRAALVATDERGNPIGRDWKNAQAASKGTQQIQRFHRVEARLKELIADVEQNGERIDPDSKQQINRMSKAEAAAAALRPYNELSSTDASMAAERAIIGPAGAFGHGWVMGADLTTLKRILAEAQEQQSVNLNTLLRPAGSQQLSPALGGKRQPNAGSEMVTIRNNKTGETKQVTREEAQRMGAL